MEKNRRFSSDPKKYVEYEMQIWRTTCSCCPVHSICNEENIQNIKSKRGKVFLRVYTLVISFIRYLCGL